MYIHVTFYIVNMAVLLGCTRKKNSAKYVFTEFQNNTGWDSDGIAWCVGLLSALFAFFSLDTTVHFSEEIASPATSVPKASKNPFPELISRSIADSFINIGLASDSQLAHDSAFRHRDSLLHGRGSRTYGISNRSP